MHDDLIFNVVLIYMIYMNICVCIIFIQDVEFIYIYMSCRIKTIMLLQRFCSIVCFFDM